MTLLDSGASSNFISEAFINQHQIPVYTRKRPIPLSSLNGQPFLTPGVQYFTDIMHLSFQDHSESLCFNVIPIKGYDVVLGIPWLRKHDPVIEWSSNTINFLSRYCRSVCSTSKPPGRLYSVPRRELSALQLLATIGPQEQAIVPISAHYSEIPIPTHYSEYAPLFHKEAADILPENQPWDHTIPLKEGFQPPFGPIYSLSAIELKALRAYLDENLKKGFIQPSSSPAGAPILFVKKKDGSLRLCVDYRGLNAITIKNRYALPLISELIDRLQGSLFFTKLDLRGAYNLVRIGLGEEWKTAFRTRYGHFEYKVMPFGLTNAPASFQALVNSVLKAFLDRFVVVYLDNILIYSKTEEEHIQHVKLVLTALSAASLFVKLEKCSFHVKQVEFLGYIIGVQGIWMDPHKIESITSWPVPKNLTELQSFLGFTNFYRRFIAQYSTLCLPLTALLKKDKAFQWIPEAQTAFEGLKMAFTVEDHGILAYFNPEIQSRVETDASDFAIGACLAQFDSLAKAFRPVAFYSRKMTPAERNYDIYDKEMLAIVESVREWRVYLEGARFTIDIVTDHKNLQYFLTTKALNRRQARWAEMLGSYDFTISYRPGNQNTKADLLSRRVDYIPEGTKANNGPLNAPLLRPDQLKLYATGDKVVEEASMPSLDPKTNVETLSEDSNPESQSPTTGFFPKDPAITMKALTSGYNKDPVTQKLVKALDKGPLDNYRLLGDKLLFRNRVYIPNILSLKLSALAEHHDHITAGHFGVRKTLERLSRIYYFPKMASFTEDYVNSCDLCQRNKHSTHKPYGLLKHLSVPMRPWSSISMDFIVKLPLSKLSGSVDTTEYDSIWIVVDRLTKMAHFVPCQETMNAIQLAKLYLIHLFPVHGLPDDVVSDRGTLFTSNFMKALCNLLAVKQKMSTAFHPQTDGQTERTNQTLEQFLRIYCDYQQSNWSDLLAFAAFAYNSAHQETIKMSPYYANYGFHPRFSTENVQTISPVAQDHVEYMKLLHKSLQDEILHAQTAQKAFADTKRLLAPPFKEGDRVWLLRKHIKTTRPSSKLDYKRLGPFEILRMIGTVAVELKLPQTMKIHPTFHISLIEAHKTSNIRPQQPDPPSIEIEGEQEWEVEEILSTKMMKGNQRKKQRHYLVQWVGYPPSEDTWEPESNLQHSKEALKAFQTKHPNWKSM